MTDTARPSRLSAQLQVHVYDQTLVIWVIPRNRGGRPVARLARSLVVDLREHDVPSDLEMIHLVGRALQAWQPQ